MGPDEEQVESKKNEWTDQFVEVDSNRPELRRFAGSIGRVVTVNCNNRALVDFSDGAWYDITTDYLRKVEPAVGKAKYDAKANSAQPFPDKQS
jgi:hypothetical protein